MMNRMKKALVVALAAVTCLTSVPYGANIVSAAEIQSTVQVDALKASTQVASDMKYFYESPVGAFANANSPEYIDFKVDKSCSSSFYLYVSQATTVKAVVLNEQGECVKAHTISADSKSWVPVQKYLGTYFMTGLDSGRYTIELTFDKSVAYTLLIGREKVLASINCKKAVLTAGFSKTLKISGEKVASWKSSNNKIATVKNGKVTAKSKGACKITATLTSGNKLSCNVTVKANEYSVSKLSVNNLDPDGRKPQLYKVSFDKKGNLVLRVRYINNSSRKYSFLQNFRVGLTTPSGKKIGTFTVSKYKVNIGSHACKDMTFTIKKANLNMKKVDLTKGVKVSWAGKIG